MVVIALALEDMLLTFLILKGIVKIADNISEIERRLNSEVERHADVDEFIRRLKSYIGVPELTREMCMELIEFVTVDECPGKYSKDPREIHIYYKLIDKNQSKPTIRCDDF